MASFALATQWWHVLIGRVEAWLGRGTRTPVRKVLLAESTTPQTYGRAYGLERAMDSAGAMIGPLAALLFLTAFGPNYLRWLFASTLIPGVLAALCIAVLVCEKPHEPQHKAGFWNGIKNLPIDFRRYLLGVGIAGLGDFSNTVLILWAMQTWTPRFGTHQATALAMAFYTGYNVIYTFSFYFSGHLADRLARNRVLASGYAIAVIPAAALLWPGGSFLKFAVVFGVSGIYMGVWETLESATSASMLPQRSPRRRLRRARNRQLRRRFRVQLARGFLVDRLTRDRYDLCHGDFAHRSSGYLFRWPAVNERFGIVMTPNPH